MIATTQTTSDEIAKITEVAEATGDDAIKIALDTLSNLAKNGSTHEIKVEAAKAILEYYR